DGLGGVGAETNRERVASIAPEKAGRAGARRRSAHVSENGHRRKDKAGNERQRSQASSAVGARQRRECERGGRRGQLGVICRRACAGLAICGSYASEVPGFYRRGGANPCARYRSEHRDFQRAEYGSAPAYAV